MACPFCEIVAGRLPASVVAQSAHALAFLDLRQAVEGHVLVIPRQHVETIFDIEPGGRTVRPPRPKTRRSGYQLGMAELATAALRNTAAQYVGTNTEIDIK